MADRKIRAGYYRRYDGKLIYLVTTAEDAETGEETVILRSYSFSEVPQYFTLSKKSFCAFVEIDGERRARYKRVTNMKITEAVISNLAEDGMRGPIRKKSAERDAEYNSRVYQTAPTYLAYAKDLCENYRFDSAKYRLCMNEKRYAAITRSDFAKLKEDIQFLDNALKTVLQDMLGHFSAGFTLDTYTHITNEMQRGAAEKIGGFMETATAKPEPEPPDPPEESRCKVIPFERAG